MKWILLEAGLLLAAIGVFAVALDVGYRLGVRRQAHSAESDRSHVNTLHGAVLGLLALLLGFTFAMAVSRFEDRKTLIVAQANAIASVAMTARLLPQSHADHAAGLVRQYLQSRLDYFSAGWDAEAIAAAESRAGQLENDLWEIGRLVFAEDAHSQPAALYAQALSNVFDIREKRRFALDDRVPAAVIVMLFLVSTTAMGLVAYSCGLNGRRRVLANLTFASLIALVLIIILDIDAPRAGLVGVSQNSLIRLQQSLTAPP